jgi:hypothetical protein
MNTDRRPLGRPAFSEPATQDTGMPRPRRLPPVGQAVFLSPPDLDEPEMPDTARPGLPGEMTFTAPDDRA